MSAPEILKTAAQIDAEQHEYWNGRGGAHWVEEQAYTDQMLAQVARAAIDHAAQKIAPHAPLAILDVGCGAGATTVMLKALFPHAAITGLDLSLPLIEAARARGETGITWLQADATTYDFGAQEFDLIFSRFGVMFFGDPTAAFAQLRASLGPQGQLVFACWRDFKQNPWMSVPLVAACKHVPWPPKLEPEDAGPFSFADPGRVQRILRGAGFGEPQFETLDLDLDIAGGKGVEAAMFHATRIGAASRAMADQPEALVHAARAEIGKALAAIWLVSATHAEGAQ